MSTWIDVPPETAFAYVADMTRHREWAVHVGSRFASRGRQGSSWWPSELKVTIYEPPHRFGFSATGGPLGTEPGRLHRHEFLFTPAKGGTDFELRRSDPLLATGLRFRVIRLLGPIFNRFVRGIRIQTVDNLKRRLEEQRGARG